MIMTSLSVVVPVYNVEQYLSQCLESLLRQQVDDLEVILVNDGSTDDSQRIIDDYVHKYPQIFRTISQSNQGQGSARNAGIQLCSKEYLTFLDSDDYLAEDGYQKVLLAMEQDACDIGVFECNWVYPDGRQEFRPSLPQFLPDFTPQNYVLSHCSPCNKIYRTSLWKTNDLRFPIGFIYEDLALIPSLAAFTSNIRLYPQKIYFYRQRENSTMLPTCYSPHLLDIIPACQNVYQLLHGKNFESELEYLMLFQLCYYASFRFFVFDKFGEIRSCINALEEMYPHWQKNAYYRKRPFLFRFYCNLLKNGHFHLAKLLARMKEQH